MQIARAFGPAEHQQDHGQKTNACEHERNICDDHASYETRGGADDPGSVAIRCGGDGGQCKPLELPIELRRLTRQLQLRDLSI